MNDIYVYTDGGSRGNPGPAALGVYIRNDKEDLAKIGKRIGNATNNVAEYSAIIEALKWILENKTDISKVYFYMDSLLACSQITGKFKIKNETLKEMIFEIKKIEKEINLPIVYAHVPREKNKMADFMVNQALDNKI